MPDLQTILLLVIAVSLAPKLVLPLLQFLPLPSKLLELIKGTVKQDEAPQWANHLVQLYNHETSGTLKDIRDGVNKTNTILENIEMCKK